MLAAAVNTSVSAVFFSAKQGGKFYRLIFTENVLRPEE
jgi:hypothetical protein